MIQRTRACRIGLLLYEGVEPIDIGGTVGVISMASRLLPGLSYVLLAENAGPLRLASGLTVLVDTDLDHAPACDITMVLGGPGWSEQVRNRKVLSFLESRSEPVASVCTGALILSAAGRLENRRATTRRQAVGQEAVAPLHRLAEFGPVAEPRVAAVIEDGDVITGGGVSLAIDAMLFIIGKFYGPEAGEAVARAIEYGGAYEANRLRLGHETYPLQS